MAHSLEWTMKSPCVNAAMRDMAARFKDGFGQDDLPTTPHELSSMPGAICGYVPTRTQVRARRLPSAFGGVFGGDGQQSTKVPTAGIPWGTRWTA